MSMTLEFTLKLGETEGYEITQKISGYGTVTEIIQVISLSKLCEDFLEATGSKYKMLDDITFGDKTARTRIVEAVLEYHRIRVEESEDDDSEDDIEVR
jgi:hypothetical protein